MQPVLPGLKPVTELLINQPGQIEKIYCKNPTPRLLELCAKAKVPVENADNARLNSLCGNGRHVAHQGLVALLAKPNRQSLEYLLTAVANSPLPLIIALDQVQDPGNLGAIARTAWALGAAGLLLPEHNSAALGAAAYKASAGSLALLPCSSAVNLGRALDQADEAGLTIYGAGLNSEMAAQNAFQCKWQLPGLLVLGSEARGIRPGVAKRCHVMLRIPFSRPFDSLNVAQAGAILMGLCASHNPRLPV